MEEFDKKIEKFLPFLEDLRERLYRGVILFVMFAGTPPFLSTKKTDKIYRMIREKAFAKFWSLH